MESIIIMVIPLTLLIVEDDFGLATMYQHIFQLEGFEIKVASTVEDATRILNEKAIDVCLTDINVIDGNMLDMISHHHSFLNNQVKFILHSGDERFRETALELDIAFAGKPIAIDALISLVKGLSQQKRTA